MIPNNMLWFLILTTYLKAAIKHIFYLKIIQFLLAGSEYYSDICTRNNERYFSDNTLKTQYNSTKK